MYSCSTDIIFTYISGCFITSTAEKMSLNKLSTLLKKFGFYNILKNTSNDFPELFKKSETEVSNKSCTQIRTSHNYLVYYYSERFY
jgi:hypothetical protein